MFILITYDVNITSPHGAKRLRNVAKECQNYGKRVQNSVFECILTDAQLTVLRNKLSKIIDTNQDSIRFYILGNNWKRKIETLGINVSNDFTDELII